MACDNLHRDIFAIIDLGSNSFHMLMVREVAGSVQVIARVKRKVRLASGLDDDNVLSQVAMARGWECLALFAERLQDIPRENIRIVATATLRLAVNANEFVTKAQQIVDHPINIISGQEEARMIYLGVAHTSTGDSRRLVIDIGGASTEVIVGAGFKPLVLNSLNIGCVTFLERYFGDGAITAEAFDKAINRACEVLGEVKEQYLCVGWQSSVGASGTVQAVQEILISQGQSEALTLEKLEAIKQQSIDCGTIDGLNISGLIEERRLVFVSGLSILIAIFKTLGVDTMTLAGGALREGVLYDLMKNMQHDDIRARTVNSLLIRHHIDTQHANLVGGVASQIAGQLAMDWQLEQYEGLDILYSAAMLHELGLIIDYRHYHRHGAYVLAESELPGFTRAQKRLLTALVANHRGPLDNELVESQTMTSALLAKRLTQILRVSTILSMRRLDDACPQVTASCETDGLIIKLPKGWLVNHPLMRAELEAEVAEQAKVGWSLAVV